MNNNFSSPTYNLSDALTVCALGFSSPLAHTLGACFSFSPLPLILFIRGWGCRGQRPLHVPINSNLTTLEKSTALAVCLSDHSLHCVGKIRKKQVRGSAKINHGGSANGGNRYLSWQVRGSVLGFFAIGRNEENDQKDIAFFSRPNSDSLRSAFAKGIAAGSAAYRVKPGFRLRKFAQIGNKKTLLPVLLVCQNEDKKIHCYQCDQLTDWLAPDGRCGFCTQYTPEEIQGLPSLAVDATLQTQPNPVRVASTPEKLSIGCWLNTEHEAARSEIHSLKN